MGNQRRADPLQRRLIIPVELRRLLFENALPADPAMPGPLRDKEIVAVHRRDPVSGFKRKRGRGVKTAIVRGLQAFHQTVDDLHVALQFIAHAHHAE